MAACRWNILILALNFCFTVPLSSCPMGFISTTSSGCIDIDECKDLGDMCGDNARCHNSPGSFYCECNAGFKTTRGSSNFSLASGEECNDIDECGVEGACEPSANCKNTIGSYSCFPVFSSKNVTQCQDIRTIDGAICGNGTCHDGPDGHYCACHAGFTNYGNKGSRCTELNCDVISDIKKEFPLVRDVVLRWTNSCLELTESENPQKLNGDDMLQSLLSAIDKLLSSGALKDNGKVSAFFHMMENILRLIGPLTEPPRTMRSSNYTELELYVHKGADLPQGAAKLSTSKAQLDIQMETAAGDRTFYPGFTTVSLLGYGNLQDFTDGFFSGMKAQEGERFKINSHVVTVTVSNQNTSHLEQPVTLTLHHLNSSTSDSNHTCVFWDSSKDGGTWSRHGCSVMESNPDYTVCSCNHLSSFAVLMAQYDVESPFELQLITLVGLSLSLVCLFLCILTFSLIRSIQSPRTTIHLHLCITLSVAIIIFLFGISRTGNRVGCAVIAGLLHFFYLAAFCWMCLEGIQLFRMVILVFNTNFKTLYMLAGGYGVPAVIVGICALVNAKGYGTNSYCWLNVKSIWWFLGPACVIIAVNIFFFLITVWKLVQKFSSLNPDLDSLQKIKAFTITAVAQLCVLGIMWIFGCFQFNKNTVALSYLFTIFGSLQGVLLFVMHCLFSKQVREEYGNIVSRWCAPRKKSYSEFSSMQSSKAQASRSTHDTGESHI